jgi:hypothetical protein
VNTAPQPLVTGAHVVDTNKHYDPIAAVILEYCPNAPRRLWTDEVQEFTRSAVSDINPRNQSEAGKYLAAVAYLAIWITDVACLPLTRDVVFNGQTIDAYVAKALSDYTDIRRRLTRLRLLQVASELGQFDPARRDRPRQRLGPLTRELGFAPYTAAEIIRFRNQGATRSTAHRRHNWMVVLALAAGCALSCTDILHLLTTDIELNDSHITIHVRGPRARSVICGSEWEADIRALLKSPLVGDHPLVIDYDDARGPGDPSTGRPKIASSFIRSFIARSADDPSAQFSVERLRTTWIVRHLEAHTDPVALIAALGDKSFSGLTRLMSYVRVPDEAELIAMFRGEARQ